MDYVNRIKLFVFMKGKKEKSIFICEVFNEKNMNKHYIK